MSSKFSIKDKIEDNRLIRVTPFRKDIRKTEPHRHNNYFEIIFLSSGNGCHFIDSRQFLITTPVLFCVRKEQVHHWELNAEPEGYVLIIKKSFVDNSFDNALKLLLTKISNHSCMYVPDDSMFSQLFELMVYENSAGGENTFHVMEGLLKALLAKIATVAKQISSHITQRADIYQAFRELLSSHNPIKNSVAYYAGLLNTTPQNLNAICRNAGSQSAAELLGEYIINEAKRLLIYTNNTVSEISAILEFTDPSHFVKYFKRFVFDTPQSYRRTRG